MKSAIQVVRAIAALLVVAMHLMNLATLGQAPLPAQKVTAILGQFGHFGVDVFFVVSGFIITTVVSKVAAKRPSPAQFLTRRAARIYPLFWVTLLAFLLIPPGGARGLEDLTHRPLSILLLEPTLAHPVAWTLVFEINFYVVAAVCLMFGRHVALALMVWCVLQLGLVVAATAGFVPPYVFFNPMSLEFCLGVILGLAAHKIALPRPLWWGALSLAWAGAVVLSLGWPRLYADQTVRVLAWAPPAAVLVWAALSHEMAAGKSNRLMVAIGDASYSIYMWHLPVFLLTSFIAGHPDTPTSFLLYLVVCSTACAAVSWLSWRYFEIPITRIAARVSGKTG
jgi:exopolysaccharide production protein ExoZ